MDKIRILIVDDHRLVRDGIRSILEEEADLVVIGEAENGREAVNLACQLFPDVVLMDIGMPLLSGLEATRQIKKAHPHIKVLVLTMHENEEYVRSVLASGAESYILKDTAARDLVQAIRTVQRGESILSPAITRLVIHDFLQWGEMRTEQNDQRLTPREREVLQLIAEGHTSKEIAEILCISIKTVGTHRTNLMKKLDLHDIGELIKYAIRKKVIEI